MSVGGLVPGIAERIPAYRDARGYRFGYDTQETPFEVAKERGLGGVIGGAIDNITLGATDFDKRGDSQRQKDAKGFLNKFIYGTQGEQARKTKNEKGLGPITSFTDGPGSDFGATFDGPRPDASEIAKDADLKKKLESRRFGDPLVPGQYPYIN